MSWYQDVSEYILNNLEEFIQTFYSGSETYKAGKGIRVNPSPCCGHNDSFSFATNKPVAGCFSCGVTGTQIQILENELGRTEARVELGKWSGFEYIPHHVDKEIAERDAALKKENEIYHEFLKYYHLRLVHGTDLGPIERQLGNNILEGQRGHTTKSIEEYGVGFSGEFNKISEFLLRKGYTQEDIEKAKKMMWIPDGNYVYPYYDLKGNIVRINTKPYERVCYGTKLPGGGYSRNCGWKSTEPGKKAAKQHMQDHPDHHVSRDGFSTGSKDDAFYFDPKKIRGKKFVILVEGENDTISVDEALQGSEIPDNFKRDYFVAGIGGGVEKGMFSSAFLRKFDAIYEVFDNDETGQKYRDQLNEEAADMPVYSIKLDSDFNDIDAYLKSALYDGSFHEMLNSAKMMDTNNVIIERIENKHSWRVKNRKFSLEFDIETYNRQQNQHEGSLKIYRGGQLADRRIGGIDKIKIETPLNYAKLALSSRLDEYYNEIKWASDKPLRSFYELSDILKYTKEYHRAIKQIAWYLHHASKEDHEKKIKYLQKRVKDQRLIAEILKEVNGFQNEDIDPEMTNFPKIQLSQYFNVVNDDAFFYFSKLLPDGDTPKMVPCLLTNKKEEIRLDLIKRKDPQHLLLIKNKYELVHEVETAVIDNVEASLQPYWVKKWVNDELDERSYHPAQLVKEIEDFIRRCYYLEESTLKVLALWIYSTYFYMLFKSGFPYLMFTGPKGTGKSTLDVLVYLLSLNAKFALDMSESALYRTITFEGGTFILDEVENLTDKKSVDSNGYAKILKGGYADLAYVYRTNMDKSGISEKFSVFGPKVISNINGLEDVIADRCITVRTFRVGEDKLAGLIDPQIFKEERRTEAHSITSRCVISALEHYKEVHRIFYNHEDYVKTGNARLSQLMKPLITMARFVGGDYEEHLQAFYNKEIKQSKEDIALGTLEGMVRYVLNAVAEEYLGLTDEKWATYHEKHTYNVPITYSPETNIFEVNNLHLKVLCEELNGGEKIDLKQVNNTLKTVLGKDFDFKEHRKHTSTTFTDEGLQRELGTRQIKVYKYYLDAKDYVDPDKVRLVSEKTTKASSLF